MKKQRFLRKNFLNTPRGITLISLVITVIILLILAGISINLLAGENGILKRVSDSVDINTIATVKEEVELKVAEILIDYYEDVYVKKEYSVNTVKGDYVEEKCPLGVTHSGYEFQIKDRKVTVFRTENNGLNENLNGILLDNGVIIWDGTNEEKPGESDDDIKIVDIKEPGRYELLYSAPDIVEWEPVEIYYDKYVENSVKCEVYNSSDFENWNEITLETDGYNNSSKMEEYRLADAENSQHLKVVLDVQSVEGQNSEINFVKVSYYALEEVDIEPQIDNDGDEIDGMRVPVLDENGNGSSTVVQELTVPEGDGNYILSITGTGNPTTTLEITRPDQSTETVSGTDINMEIPAGSKIKSTTVLGAGDGVNPIKIYKRKSESKTVEPSEIKEQEEQWVTKISRQYWYVKQEKGYWDKCFVDENEIGATGIVDITERKRIKVLYKTSDDGKNWGSAFSDLKEAETKKYLKIFVKYQTLGGEDYEHDGNYKIQVTVDSTRTKLVTYNLNGGEGTAPETKEYEKDTNVTVEFPNNLTKTDYVFLGWATTATATTAEYTSTGNTSLTIGESDVILYAVWEKVSITKLASVITSTNYGDKINYSANGVTDWKIFYNDGENVFIITSDYVPVSKLTASLSKAGMTTKGTYQTYWASIPSTIQSGWNIEKSKYMMANYNSSWSTNSYNNFKCVSTLLTTSNWNDFANIAYAEWAIGSPTIEMLISSWNAKGYTKLYCNNTDGEGYFVGKSNIPTTANINMSSSQGYNDTLFFPHQATYNSCSGYWVASPSAVGAGKLVRVYYLGGIGNDGQRFY